MSHDRRPESSWPYLAALAAGAIIVRSDMHTDDTGIIAAMVFTSAFLLGSTRPAAAWRWTLIVGASIFATHVVGRALGFRLPYEPAPNVFGSLIALIPAFLGAYAGAGARRLFTTAHPDRTT